MIQVGELSIEEMDKILNLFPESFMQMPLQEQKISVSVYRLMLQGKPLSAKLIATSLGLVPEVVNQFLDHCSGIDYNDAGSIIGYWGLSLSKTGHRFEVDGHELYTWCAWDALFIPGIIGKTAMVTSICPVTGSPIRLTVSPNAVNSTRPVGTVVSFIEPEAVSKQESIVKSFCFYVNFFSSKSAGEHWIAENPGTFLLTLNEAFALGHRKNELQYVLTS
ncbi:alkylmercury lyase [Mariprofundus micogutta]|uniref:Alkylmercury lyase n=2 Tax=Mariprofundus micogutta TaxID=1921010 RepID=A0A1L8CP46_9PROT|nr:alkylmercury lyase [Mariprofundus micogutta]